MNRLGLAWVGMAALGLGAVIAGEISGGGAVAPVPPVPPSAYSNAAASAHVLPGTSEQHSVATILARPLFDSTRRAAGVAVTSAGALRLSGVIVGPLGRQAIFEPTGGGKPVVVREGERVGNDVVRSIGPDLVLMVGTDGARALRPAYAGAGGRAQ